MLENKSRTEISELGEFGLIDHLTKNIRLHHASTEKGAGDDAAVLDHSGRKTIVTTDLLTEGIHFDLAYVPLRHLGYKSVIVNLSDVYAMNATPTQITVSIAFSNRFSLEAIEELYSGMLLACDKYKVDLAGGDTTSSQHGLVISITALGTAAADEIAYRDGAAEGELICVSGDLGAAYMGLQILEREKQVYLENPAMQPDLQGKDYILERQLKPEARGDVLELLRALEVKPTSMIDISDGLASEILHIATRSGLGCKLFEEKIPIDPMTYESAREFNLDPTVCALSGGEDYELLFTIAQKDYEKVKNQPDISVIGHMTAKDEGCYLISKSGQVHQITAQGWDAFLKKKE
ncbi:thiamine-phosphate kinase [Anseongella ginsenosidimutans]|uniref:Thiamine-monophosphate kinase n=1 Tax=Anseongella ginsenosidimutans TaxID=496056 RepID=A0A4R3KUF1_9SPHI|nr:thiamine-phosphate kinase [Anseongella ginsenosidimutans]QEC54156.1 thiamine-phosphate kinase [Anseongella ginsenosidimutans]TCS88905.1 thiamine-phosphate kinase [Anseongella ginsenosidimutans]